MPNVVKLRPHAARPFSLNKPELISLSLYGVQYRRSTKRHPDMSRQRKSRLEARALRQARRLKASIPSRVEFLPQTYHIMRGVYGDRAVWL
jgi:hypothetical protein